MHPYKNQLAILTTKHEKLALIAPALLEVVGLEVTDINLDTDQLGTFSGELPRAASPLETAIAKAKLGMAATGTGLGLASEGSIGPDPQNPFLASDIEIMVLVDQERDLVIHEFHRSFEIVAATTEVSLGQDLGSFFANSDFPTHHLIAKAKAHGELRVIKGIDSLAGLENALHELARFSEGGQVILETDFRANHSPSRRVNIQAAAQKLAARLAQLCESCETPGFGQVRYVNGVKCSGCGMQNPDAVAAERLGCVSCDHEIAGRVLAESIPPERCDWCNP
jgi:hypothetical protein